MQGNVPGRGIEALGRARSVTNNHLAQTIDLMTRARLGLVPEPDFILWPENSTDIDPGADVVTELTVQAAAEIAGKPILVGAVTDGPGIDERQTTAMWWDPSAVCSRPTTSATWCPSVNGSPSAASCCRSCPSSSRWARSRCPAPSRACST